MNRAAPTAPHVLGVSALYHNAAAALVRGGEIVTAVEEERFTRRKQDARFPEAAIAHCLGALGGAGLDAVAFYEDEALSFDRVLAVAAAEAPASLPQWREAAARMLGEKARIHARLAAACPPGAALLKLDHHRAHAASAFYPSPFERAAVLVVDGVGEWSTTSIHRADAQAIETLAEIHFPHSLGLLYSAFTFYCGFKVNSGEYKLMGLAPYGEPRFARTILDRLIEVKPDGSFRLDLDFFDFTRTDRLFGARFEALFGGPARAPETAILRRHCDLAASIQRVTELVMGRLAATALRLAGCPDLCLAGGVALNCVANGRLLRTPGLRGLWIQPAAGDAGGALGAALYAARMLAPGAPLPAASRPGRDGQRGSLLGPAFGNEEVGALLSETGFVAEFLPDPAARHERVARALAAGQVVGYLRGAAEYGPRSLGARSILADCRSPEMQSRVNLSIKQRESWRPFAPIVLAERASEYFDCESDAPYMLTVHQVKDWTPGDHAPHMDGEQIDLIAIVRQARSAIAAVTHVDGSARVQTLRRETQPDLHAIMTRYAELTGCAVLLNTSFNVRGEPIVLTPRDALVCFARTAMDLLVAEDVVVARTAQSPATLAQRSSWRRRRRRRRRSAPASPWRI